MLDSIASDSRRTLLLAIKRAGALSVDDAGTAIDRSMSTVREHLAELRQRGMVERVADAPSGRGRPRHRYRLTPEGEALFPGRDRELAGRLIAFLLERGETDLLEDFFNRFWAERTERVMQEFEASDVTDRAERLHVLKQILADEGFMPDINECDGAVVIRECNCPFPEAVKQTRLPCWLEAAFLEAALETALERVEYIPDGHDACAYTFAEPAAYA